MERLDGFTADGLGNVIQGEIQRGDVVRIDGKLEVRWFPPEALPPRPLILSKTAFQDYAVSQLGGGLTGMSRFTEIMDAAAASPVGAVRFVFARYEAADRFEKTNTATLTQIMAGNGTMTAEERTAIIDNWPEA